MSNWQSMIDENTPKIEPLRAEVMKLEEEQRIAFKAIGYYPHTTKLETARSDLNRAAGYVAIAREQMENAANNAAGRLKREAEVARWDEFQAAQRRGGDPA